MIFITTYLKISESFQELPNPTPNFSPWFLVCLLPPNTNETHNQSSIFTYKSWSSL